MTLQQAESTRVKTIVQLFCDTALHVPADKAGWKPDSKTKSAKEILEHIAAANSGFAMIIQGQSSGLKLNKADRKDIAIQTKDLKEAIQAVKTSGDKLSQAIGSLNDAQLREKRTMPWGEEWEMPRLLVTASTHLSYHWGQLAYLQTMWGDLEDHM